MAVVTTANLLLNPSFEGESGDWQPMNQADAVTLQWMSDPAQAKDGSGFLRISTAQRKISEALQNHDSDAARTWMARHIRDFRKGFEIAGIDLEHGAFR